MPQPAGGWAAAQEPRHIAAVDHIVHLVAEVGTVGFGPVNKNDVS